MALRTTALVSALALAAAGVAGCGGDDPDHIAAGDGFSIEAGLAELPVPPVDEGEVFTVTIADLDAATEVNGAERPDGTDDAEAVGRWLVRAQGTSAEEGEAWPPIFVGPIETVGGSRGAGQADEVEDELGWSVVDVEAVAEVVAPPFRFGVVTGDLDEETLQDADLEDLGNGVFSAGEGEDGETDVAKTTAARPIGAPLRMAAEDGRLAASSSTDAVEGWSDGDIETLAHDDDLRGIAAALDEEGAVSALIAGGVGPAVEQRPGGGAPVISEAFTDVGIGWAVDDDGEAAVTVAYAFANERTARDAVEQVEAIYAEGVSFRTLRPISDLVTVGEVEAEGALVVAHLTVPDDGRPQALADMLITGDAPFTVG